ncbi:hypothetical protein LCGC14_0232720 [marine sediment metagenome]|uniref:Uncharacterized protein n=1 Tax=marine sediment metagenome TaxID=412755 RepID=A0A0F9WUW4_9ZZZZ
MLVYLNISQWTARKYDRKVSGEVAESHNARGNVGKYYKVLLKSPSLDMFRRTSDAARNYHYDRTLPWNDGGVRILPVGIFMDYNHDMKEFRVTCEEFADEFIRIDYKRARKDAVGDLGTMHNDMDYPKAEAVRRKFGFEINYSPLPDAGDWRVDIDKKHIAALKKSLNEQIMGVQERAMTDLWERVHRMVTKMHERLSDEDNIFRDSLVGNMRELTDLLPHLNISGDPRMNKLTTEIKLKLCGTEADALRTDGHVRAKTAKDADAILKTMSGFMK